MITISGYLTQAKLAQVLQQLVPDGWLGHEVAVIGSRHRWDVAYQSGGSITAVEYDGDEHYRNSLKIKIDRLKDAGRSCPRGVLVVRFPYWVQLDSTTLRQYFGLEAEIEQPGVTSPLSPYFRPKFWGARSSPRQRTRTRSHTRSHTFTQTQFGVYLRTDW